MRESVRAAFYAFNAPLEGEVPWFYQDVKGLVSIGVGLMVDPVSLATSLPMVHPDGSAAKPEEIAAEWSRIKSLGTGTIDQGNPAARGGHLYAKPHAHLRLTQEGLIQTVLRKLYEMQGVLVAGFPDFLAWPADAQLGALSLAWACGPAYWKPEAGRAYFPKLTAALRDANFMVASVECFMPEEKTISGLRPRNKANRLLFQNGAIAIAQYLDLDALHYPRDLSVTTATTEPPPPPPAESQPIIHPPVPMPTLPYRFDADDTDEDDGKR